MLNICFRLSLLYFICTRYIALGAGLVNSKATGDVRSVFILDADPSSIQL